MADFNNFDPAQYVLTFGGILVQGYAADTFINAARNEDSYSQKVGSQGDVTRIRSRNKSGIVTVTLMAESPTNDRFSARLVADEATLSGLPAGALMLKDLNGNTVAVAANAWLQKFADIEVAQESSNREWVIACAEILPFVGGAA